MFCFLKRLFPPFFCTPPSETPLCQTLQLVGSVFLLHHTCTVMRRSLHAGERCVSVAAASVVLQVKGQQVKVPAAGEGTDQQEKVNPVLLERAAGQRSGV